MSQKSVSPADKAIGAKVRARRLMAGMSQEKLADALNITFQQVQKYEKGTNRVSVGRLIEIARTLDTDAAWFLDGVTEPAKCMESLLTDRDTVRLVRAFNTIGSARGRQVIIDVAEAMAEESRAKAG